MASGFKDQLNPQPVFRVGKPGQKGAVEMQDLIFTTLGPNAGAILMEWNLGQTAQGSAAIWDVHFRVGGTAGSRLQGDACAKVPSAKATLNPNCFGAFMLLHVTQQASLYAENAWFWVADHELDRKGNGQINIYNGRGVLIESKGPVWLYGTSSEHSSLYNYQVRPYIHQSMLLPRTS
jgi:glucan 1,3-beta-glucosidase